MENGTVMFFEDPDFPVREVEYLGTRLDAAGILVAGFVPPAVGMLDWRGIRYAQRYEGIELVMVLDRNLVSRMARVACEGRRNPDDMTERHAIDVMAFAQAMDIVCDPSISFHELAHNKGNQEALKELGWFRASDKAAPMAWVDLALDRTDKITLSQHTEQPFRDLALPLARWRRNYLVMLKVAELELQSRGLNGLKKARSLLNWMEKEYFLAGAAMLYATLFFSPNSPGKSIFKKLLSRDREAAVQGIRNAAWDATYISEFQRHVNAPPEPSKRYFFASADKALVKVARVTFGHAGQGPTEESLAEWWHKDAGEVASMIGLAFMKASQIPKEQRPAISGELLLTQTAKLEQFVLDWAPI